MVARRCARRRSEPARSRPGGKHFLHVPERDVVIIGGGLVGLGTAYALATRSPMIQVQVVEKEPEVGRHQSSHNSGVLHAGLYYRPGSAKARLAVAGIRKMVRFC